MTIDEAREVLRVALHGATKQDLDDARVELMTLHLGPLPFERTRRRVHEYVLTNKWLSSLEELLDAAGVSTSARPDLARAVHEGGELWPSLRSMSGWEYVPRGGPYPEGVALYFREAGQPLPTGARVEPIALPAAPREVDDEPADAGVSIRAAIGSDLQQRKNGALRRLFEQRQHPPSAFVPDRDAMPPVLRQAVDAAEAERDRLAHDRHACRQQERAYREMCEAAAARLRDRAPDLETARQVAVELLQRLADDEGYGVGAVLEVVRDALIPGGRIDFLRAEHGENPDQFVDAPGSLIRLRVDMRKV